MIIPATGELLCSSEFTLEVIWWLQRGMDVSIRPSFSSRSECLGINIEIISICFSLGNDLLSSDLLVSLASVCSWSAPRPLAGGEDAILFDVG